MKADVGDWDIIGELFTVVNNVVFGFISIGLSGPAKSAAFSWFISIIDMLLEVEGMQGMVLMRTERDSRLLIVMVGLH